MKVFLIVCFAMIAMSNAFSLKKWNAFKLKYSKEYDNVYEEYRRLNIFLTNAKEVEHHNRLYKLGKVTYRMGINEFSDMTDNEFAKQMACAHSDDAEYTKLRSPILKATKTIENRTNFNQLSDVDWRTQQLVTEVRNQGSCGACWAFAAIGALEGQVAKHSHKLVTLSEQDLIDCSSNAEYGNNGCDGGWSVKGFKYIKHVGVNTEADYKYQEKKQPQCHHDPKKPTVKIFNYGLEQNSNEAKLIDLVTEIGPIAVVIRTDTEKLKKYEGAIYSDYRPKKDRKDKHSVLVVGFTNDYYIVKNSWGKKWGLGWYFYLIRSKDGSCDVAEEISYPILYKKTQF